MKVEEIREIVHAIKQSKIRNKENYYADIYPAFKKEYPILYEKVCKNEIDDEKLEFMLQMLDMIHTNQTTQFDASAKVGQMLYDEYVEPRLPK